MSREFLPRLKVLVWAIAHHDIRLCQIHGPIGLKVRQRPWSDSSWIYPALEVTLTVQQPTIYLPSEVQDAYDRRDWTDEQWANMFSDIPF